MRVELDEDLVTLTPIKRKVSEYRDKVCRGLMLRVYPSGVKSYFLWYESIRRSERIPIGNVENITLKQARGIVCDRLAVLRLPDGRYAPHGGRGSVVDVVTAEGPQNITVETLIGAYLDEVPLAEDSLKQYRLMLKGKIRPRVGTRFAEKMTRLEWVKFGWEIREKHGGVISNRTIEMVRSAYYWGARIGLIPACSAVWEDMPMPFNAPRRPRKLLLSKEHIRASWVALDAFGHHRWQPDATRLLLLSWMRQRQVIDMRRDEILGLGTPEGMIVVDPTRPGSKRRKKDPDPAPHILPITDGMETILRRRLMLTDGPLLFPAPIAHGKPAAWETGWQTQWAHATACVLKSGPPPKNSAQLKKWFATAEADRSWHLHDVRAAGVSHSRQALGADIGLMPLMLGHVSRQSVPLVSMPNVPFATQIYDRALMLDQRRELLTKWEEWLTNPA